MNATVLKTATAPALQPPLAVPNWSMHLTALMTNAVEHPTTDERTSRETALLEIDLANHRRESREAGRTHLAGVERQR